MLQKSTAYVLSTSLSELFFWGRYAQNYKKIGNKIIRKMQIQDVFIIFEIDFITILSEATIF